MTRSSHRITALLVAGLLLLQVGCSRSEGPATAVQVGSPAPQLTLPALDGSEIDLRSFVGHRVILSFWATWCQPCRGEIPELLELHRASDIEVITVALDDAGAATVQPFVDDHDIEYRVLLGDQEVFERFRGYTIPYTLVLDDSLHIEKIYRGPIDLSDLPAISKSPAPTGLAAASGGSR